MELKNLRAQHARLPAEQRRQAAQWAFDGAHAGMLMAEVTKEQDLVHRAWHEAVAPLAIDPEYAPAMLTVGSLEYQYGRVEEAILLFLQLATLPGDTEDLPEVIDKAGNFLIHQGDHLNATQLYAAAARTFPSVPLYHAGLRYCAAACGKPAESVTHYLCAVELNPDSHLHLNDLGYSLLQAGQYAEAEDILQRAVQKAPPGYDLAMANLNYLRESQERACIKQSSRAGHPD